ncbi:MAG: dimethylarginine dimethylaminohydrolase family protein, partial [Armatimonadota bacterium]
MATFLMCRPTYYGIEYEINPWMSVQRPADNARALAQWERLVQVLTEDIGAEIKLVEPVPGLPDMCFTANAGFACGGMVVPSRFRYPQRQGEEPHFERWFRDNGFELRPLPACRRDDSTDAPCFEGAGDALPCAGRVYAGYHYRTDIRSHADLGDIIGAEVLSLGLADRHFYHIDTCFCPLDGDAAMYYPPAFDEYARTVLRARLGDLIEAPPDDARDFGCNAVVVRRHVVLNEPCTELGRALEAQGYHPHYVDLSEFIKAGGSAKCLTLRLDEPKWGVTWSPAVP